MGNVRPSAFYPCTLLILQFYSRVPRLSRRETEMQRKLQEKAVNPN
jgi:hypothetical protein